MIEEKHILFNSGFRRHVGSLAAATDRFANSVTSTSETVVLNYQNFHVEHSSTGKLPMHCDSGLEEAAALPAAFESKTQA